MLTMCLSVQMCKADDEQAMAPAITGPADGDTTSVQDCDMVREVASDGDKAPLAAVPAPSTLR